MNIYKCKLCKYFYDNNDFFYITYTWTIIIIIDYIVYGTHYYIIRYKFILFSNNWKLLLRNSSHHRVRTSVTNLFRQKKLFEVFEEVHCLSVASNNTQNRRADIIVINRSKDRDLILDPTIHWETNDPQQDSEVNEEKKNIYEPWIPWLQ